MKRVPATMGFEIICDDADYAALSSVKWLVRASLRQTTCKRGPHEDSPHHRHPARHTSGDRCNRSGLRGVGQLRKGRSTVTVHTKIEPFNALEAYEREREENRRLFAIINKVLFVADDLVRKVERTGEDVTVKKAILEQARRERLA